jgi:heme-degrading monooxygenase HmoA
MAGHNDQEMTMSQRNAAAQPPYCAVIFTSTRTAADPEGYEAMANRMVELAQQQPGFLGIESVRGADGVGITVSYWDNEDNIRRWHEHAEHLQAQALGRSRWYAKFQLRVCRVERAYEFPSIHQPAAQARDC